MKTILVTDQIERWNFLENTCPLVQALDYLTQEDYINSKDPLRVINLCKSYQYQSIGYYVSLLAQARHHKVFPSTITLHDLDSPSITTLAAEKLKDDIDRALKPIKSDSFVLSVYFGKNLSKRYDGLCYKLHGLFPMPMFKASFKKNADGWTLKRISVLNIAKIPDNHLEFFQQTAKDYLNKKRFKTYHQKRYKHSLGILVDPKELTPPSNTQALKKFIQAGDELGIYCELITKDDYKFIAEYDALFIRETTAVNHHTYKFSRRAQSEGLVVLDDPESILKCTNKVYLTELMTQHHIPYPETHIITKYNCKEAAETMPMPCVIKVPDSAFSQGVVKVHDEYEFKKIIAEYLQRSELLIAQAFLPTDYDWRIGILNHKPFYACKYFMAKDHWQIVNWGDNKDKDEGEFLTVSLDDVPANVLNKALKASKLIGSGLYGVDLKQVGKKVYLIEVNDNPNIDHGIEDAFLGDGLYSHIMNYFLERITYAK